MKKNIKLIFVTFIVVFSVLSCSATKQKFDNEIIAKNELESVIGYKNGYNSLINKAEKALNTKFRSVVEKTITPPSGDKHDYLSRATYYWENPNSENGLPWIYKDGEPNKQSFLETDHKYYYEAMEAIRDLSLAYNFSKNKIYAKRAVEILNDWFINESTKMKPNLNYAQGIPGKYDGTKSGIIDSRAILWVIQGIELIKDSSELSKNTESKFKFWCQSYLDWLLTSQFGIEESKSANNHGTFYDLQVASFANFIGKNEIAIETLNNVKKTRIETQILPNGSQTHELVRAHPHMYSVFNLSALIDLALLGDKYDINLWDYKTDKCGSIIDALEFMISNTKLKKNAFKDDAKMVNLIRIIPKANLKFEGKYKNILNTEILNNQNIDLTSVYFVN